MRKSLAVVTLTAVLSLSSFGQEGVSSKALALEDALRLTIERNPQLRAAGLGVQAAEGRLSQAGAIPNPTVSAEVGDFGGEGDLRGFVGSETTITLEQTIEAWGRRTDRKKLAMAARNLSQWERDALRLDVIKETTGRFVEVLAAQEELALSRDAYQAAGNIHQAVSNRVAAGKDSPVEEAKARAELARAGLAVARAGSRVAVGREALCAMWADRTPAFESVHGDLGNIAQDIPEVAMLNDAMSRSPDWARWADEIQAAEWAVQSERRSRIPDLTFGAGIRQSQADDSQAFIASVGLELPLFDLKRGNASAARADLERRRAEQEVAQTALRIEMKAAYELLTTTQKAALTIAQDALPAAEQAFAAAQVSYASGKTGYLDIQDARRLLIEMRRQQIETLVEYHSAVAQVQRLTGIKLSTIQ